MTIFRISLLTAILAACGACGQKGDLYLPEQAAAVPVALPEA